MEHRLEDLQTLTKTILSKKGKRPPSHPDHPTTRRLTTLTIDSLRQEKQQSNFTAECVIHILCNTDLAYRLTDRGYNVPGLDYLGFPYGLSPLGQPMTLNGFLGDKWEYLDRTEGWGNWFESITRVCKSWHIVTQRRRSNPSFLAVCDYLWGARGGLTSETRILREIQTSHNTYTQLQSICVGNEAINTKTQAHELINTLCDLTPTLKQLSLPGTNTEIGLRAAKSLAIRGLALRDSMELVTWLHGLPVTGAKEFLNLMKDSPRVTVLHVLEGCEQIALLNLVTQGYLPETPLRDFGGHPVGHQQVPFVLVFDLDLFPRLTYMQNLITHIKQGSADRPKTMLNIITYEPLDKSEGRLPRRRAFSTHPELRPTVKMCRGEPHENNLGYVDLVELFGYDEERGLLELVLVKGTMIEVPLKDEHGANTFVKGRVSSTIEGSLQFKVRLLGDMDHEKWVQTRSELIWKALGDSPPPRG